MREYKIYTGEQGMALLQMASQLDGLGIKVHTKFIRRKNRPNFTYISIGGVGSMYKVKMYSHKSYEFFIGTKNVGRSSELKSYKKVFNL